MWWGSHRGFQGDLGDTRGGKTAGSGEEGEDPETREGAVLFPIPTPALSRRQPFPGCADPWGTVSRKLCLLVFLNGKNQGSDQDPIAL